MKYMYYESIILLCSIRVVFAFYSNSYIVTNDENKDDVSKIV